LVGLITAYCISERSPIRFPLVILEANEICSGTSGNSTGKVSALHRKSYSEILSVHGKHTAELFAGMNLDGVELFREIMGKIGIESKSKSAFVYCPQTNDQELNEKSFVELQSEFEAAKQAGLDVEWTDHIRDFPVPIQAAIRLRGQLQVDPVRFGRKLAEYLTCKDDSTVIIYENSRVEHFSEGIFGKHVLKTRDGTIMCNNVVFATQIPISDRGLHFAYNYPSRSYCSAFALNQGSRESRREEEETEEKEKSNIISDGMLISISDDNIRSIRAAGFRDEILVISGESHIQGSYSVTDTREKFKALHEFAKEHWDVSECISNWSAHDFVPADHLPYIGFLHRFTSSCYVATGFNKWGYALAAAAGLLISDYFLNLPSPYQNIVSSTRFDPIESIGGVLKEQKHVIRHFFRPPNIENFKSLKDAGISPEQGRLVKVNGRLIGAYCDEQGEMHVVDPSCQHHGCIVAWNSAERSWDCPCHGSRYDFNGKLLNGPSCKNLCKLANDW
jgi:glycine/D-amino acid oxidase-like deaminating enzyme/nitrite reductase/ring-hydroxylating ferredoxin subunit